MSSQGLVAVVLNGKVVMKFICNFNGNNAKRLASLIKDSWPMTIDEAYSLAQYVGFGSKECLVVMDEKQEKFYGKMKLHSRYRETFTHPEFNPVWHLGLADFTEIVEIDDVIKKI